MTKRKRFYFWIGYVAFVVLILFYVNRSDGAKPATNLAVICATTLVCFSIAQWLSRYHLVSTKAGWKVLGPDPTDLILMGMPFYIAFKTIIQQSVALYVFADPSNFSYSHLLMVYTEQPLFSMLVGSFVIYGILKGFVRRLRWNEHCVEYRDMFFETRSVRWDEIDRIELGGAFVSNEAILKNGLRLGFPKLVGRAGIDQLEADARAKGILIFPAKGNAASAVSA